LLNHSLPKVLIASFTGFQGQIWDSKVSNIVSRE